MPIGGDECEEGRTSETLEMQVLAFLKENPDEAFTEWEITEEVIGPIETDDMKIAFQDSVNMGRVIHALKTLKEEGKVTDRVLKQKNSKETYWMAV